MAKMIPLTPEEYTEHELDTEVEYLWDKNKNIRTKNARMFRRFDMTSEMAKEIQRKGHRRELHNAQDKVRQLIEEETEFTYEDAPASLILAAEEAIIGSSSDRKHFLSEARGVGNLSQKSKDVAPQKIIVKMDKEVREAMIRALEIIQEFRQPGAVGADSGDSLL